ncbi:shikimate dehydrogenase [Coxiella endosymbiont of Amblyomma americanum]|uniref:shikimate dehydrogenase n=1 Tax=Coxiella endosymbiont of Amblyomma americanum TaxID=325775 RepID=UPI00057F8E62|nr:shikimate dehydrogenase [Coxiella endosymbiont of Amblyomma americanum]AJC50169.1 shikimate dehydrogenase [Coxiella endosymbiont of Amblyomma americanum]AUJ58529.1 shikimate dehydrogenase [Coxiella-like endosymbiont of Amblyomma americanum]
MEKYAIIGNPVAHSLSPIIFQAFGAQVHKIFCYIKIETSLNGFANALKKFQKIGGKGVNITAPFKHKAYNISNKSSQEAKEAQAASALLFLNNGATIYSVNYDGLGLKKDLVRCNINLTRKSILIVGAGGAVSGILGSLTNDAISSKIVIVNRTISKAYKLVSYFRSHNLLQCVGYNDLQPTPYDVIIHATSLGHQGKLPPLPSAVIGPKTCCYDLSYGRAALPFLQWAKSKGASKCFDGLGMLVEHNAALFYLWFGIYPNTSSVLKKLNDFCTFSI